MKWISARSGLVYGTYVFPTPFSQSVLSGSLLKDQIHTVVRRLWQDCQARILGSLSRKKPYVTCGGAHCYIHVPKFHITLKLLLSRHTLLFGPKVSLAISTNVALPLTIQRLPSCSFLHSFSPHRLRIPWIKHLSSLSLSLLFSCPSRLLRRHTQLLAILEVPYGDNYGHGCDGSMQTPDLQDHHGQHAGYQDLLTTQGYLQAQASYFGVGQQQYPVDLNTPSTTDVNRTGIPVSVSPYGTEHGHLMPSHLPQHVLAPEHGMVPVPMTYVPLSPQHRKRSRTDNNLPEHTRHQTLEYHSAQANTAMTLDVATHNRSLQPRSPSFPLQMQPQRPPNRSDSPLQLKQSSQSQQASTLQDFSPPSRTLHHHHRLPSHTQPSERLQHGQSSSPIQDDGPATMVGREGMPSPAARPKGPKLKFSGEDDALLIELKETKNLTWKQIADFFPGRTSGTLQVRYCTKLKVKTNGWSDEMVSLDYFIMFPVFPRLSRQTSSTQSLREILQSTLCSFSYALKSG